MKAAIEAEAKATAKVAAKARARVVMPGKLVALDGPA
jgi:hypothetical protein